MACDSALLLLLLVLVLAAAAGARTVRYSSAPNRRMYELQVPGSAPIRIIEAGEPLWGYSDGAEHRSTTSTAPPGLEPLLKERAHKLKADRKKYSQVGEGGAGGDKAKRWGLVGLQQHRHPYEDHKGWVTLEAVPWSTSKVSKWESHYKHNAAHNSYPPSDKYNSWGGGGGGVYSERPDMELDARPGPVPNVGYYSKPIHGFEEKPLHVQPEPSDWSLELPSKPAWMRPAAAPSSSPWSQPALDAWQHAHGHPDIITDGRPSDFPASHYEPLADRPFNAAHPATHPANGNGEWVLLSTTKGYQYPRTKNQRSIELSDSIAERKGVRLTVLPPSNGTSVNMTTSHGGLLEVESTFESVEASQNKLTSHQHQHQHHHHHVPNKTKPLHKGNRRPVKVARPAVQRPLQAVLPHKQDPSAVLAAVGAGMVPATMAMLVPFVTGRKRRSVPSHNDHSSTMKFC